MISKYKKVVNPNKAGIFEGSFFLGARAYFDLL